MQQKAYIGTKHCNLFWVKGFWNRCESWAKFPACYCFTWCILLMCITYHYLKQISPGMDYTEFNKIPLFFNFLYSLYIIALHCGHSSFPQKWQAAKDWSHYLQTLKIESRFIGRKQICLIIKPWTRIGTNRTVYSFLILLIVNRTLLGRYTR